MARTYKNIRETYAIAVRDDGELFECFRITRSDSGDVYFNWLLRPELESHRSYHQSGYTHHKHGKRIAFWRSKRQCPDQQFRGVEELGNTSIRSGDARAAANLCDPLEFTQVMEIPDEALRPEQFGCSLTVELAEPGHRSRIASLPGVQVIQQEWFRFYAPWICSTLYKVRPGVSMPE